jgi:2-octaprenyl-6-methoxyphenol hydroxylase
VAEPISVQVCIMGAGPVGGTLACRLATAGLRVAVIDRAPLPPMEHPAFDGRAYAITGAMRPLLEQSGVWDRLPDPTCPIHDIRVSDGRVGQRASPLFLHFDHREVGAPFGWMVEARSLRRALNARLHALPELHVFAPATASITRGEDAADIQIEGGPALRAQLIVGAEGRQSALREAAGIPVSRVPYSQTGIVCAVSHERPHNNVALEHFLPGGPFAVLPMPASPDALPGGAPNVSAVVWSDRTQRANQIMALDNARFGREIRRRMGNYLGEVQPIGRRWAYPLSAMLVQRYTDTRLALAGDAAHGIHPIAGQGLNLGFRDAIALTGLLLEAHAAGQDLGSPDVLTRYQRQRRPDNLAMLAATDALDRLFSTDNRPLRLARDTGIAAVHRIKPLKRFFMRAAMGTHAAPVQ